VPRRDFLAGPAAVAGFPGRAFLAVQGFGQDSGHGGLSHSPRPGKKEKELAVSGPYRYTRNPLYLGNFILGLSIAIGACSWWSAGLFAAYFLVFYPPVIQEEKARMKRLFPEEYEDYKKKVPLFFPCLKSRISSNGTVFDGGLYRKNREIRALIGATIIWAVLIARMLIF